MLLAWGLCGCLRFDYELVTDAATRSEPFEDLAPTSTGPPPDVSLETDAGSDAARSPGPGRNDLSGDQLWDPRPFRREQRGDFRGSGASLVPGTPGTGTVDGGSGAAAARACRLSGDELVVNGFDMPSGSLQARGPGNPTSSWSGSVGNPSAGAMEFENAGGGELFYAGPLGDLRGRRMSLNVQVSSGTAVRVRLFVESGQQRRRANAAFSSPPLGQWDCAQLSMDAPDAAESGFDAADLVGAGLEIEASGQVRVYVDQIAY